MKQKSILIKLLVFIFLLFSASAYSIPNLISYQGVLNDINGTPMSSTVNMTFKLYDVDTGGIALWNETQNVQVSNGLFNVKLGLVQQLPSEMFDTDTLFLGIQVASDAEMTPRQQITSAAFAHKTPLVNQDFLPIGTILARTTIAHQLAAGSFDATPGSILIDSDADFINANIKPNMMLHFTLDFGSLTQLDSNEWSMVKESILSDLPTKGHLVSKVEHMGWSRNSHSYGYVSFIHTDGSVSNSPQKATGTAQLLNIYNNPSPDKPVYKTQFWARISPTYCDASSDTCGPLYNTFLKAHFSGYIRIVDSGTQLILENDFFKINFSLSYYITNTPILLDQWVECNGQTIDDPDSYYFGQTLPDLNGSTPFVQTSTPVIWIMRIK